VFHSTEFISEVHITDYCRPKAHSMLPAVTMNCDIRVILTWGVTWGINSPPMIYLLVNFDSQIDHIVVLVDQNTSRGLHSLLIFGKDHVLSEVVFGVKFCQVVTTDLVRVKVSTRDPDNIGILALICALVGAINVDRPL
jgi:hypothetical protein